MIIESAHIKNYRSILDETLSCDTVTALVGANGAGKSSFLRGLDLFYNPSPKVDSEDFYNGDTSQEMVVAVTFTALNEEAKALFSNYMQGDKLTVERVFSISEGAVSSKYHGATLQDPNFQPIRDGLAVKDKGKTAKEAYQQVRGISGYETLPNFPAKLADVAAVLKQWEAEHPGNCQRSRDDGQFFGFKEVAQGYLGRFTKFLFIPAVRDASTDTADGKGSVFFTLMELVVRSVLANREELKAFKEATQQKYEEILNPENLTELKSLSEGLTRTLNSFVPNSSVNLNWLPTGDINIPLPQADVKLVEDGYPYGVSRTGHGLQRAFILTMLQHLALAQTATGSGNGETPPAPKMPNLVLAIEEPELYQHPNRQRHLAKMFQQLAEGKTPGVADKTQIIYATHSPLFVGIDRIEQVRLLRKIPNGADKPRISRVIRTNLQELAEILWKAEGETGTKFTGETLLPRLKSIMTPWMSEGFFADVAVLVEGEDDRAAILGAANFRGLDLESQGVSVIPCGGKTSIDRPAAIFQSLGIPVYLVWDGDKGKSESRPQDNHRLLRLMGKAVEDWPSQCSEKCACFEVDLETALRCEIGQEVFDKHLCECQAELCFPKKSHALKNPVILSRIIKCASQEGKKCTCLERIVDSILKLKN